MPSAFRSSANTTMKREFILHSQGEDGYVEVSPSDTLSDVRRLILEDFDSEQLPRCGGDGTCCASTAGEGEGDDGEQQQKQKGKVCFAFRVNDIRISAKQEVRKNAFELLESNAKVELVPKRQPTTNKRSRGDAADTDPLIMAENVTGNGVKRAKMAGAVSPFFEATSAAGSVIAPVRLDTKFAASGDDGTDDVAAADDGYDSDATMDLEVTMKKSETLGQPGGDKMNENDNMSAEDEEAKKGSAKRDDNADAGYLKELDEKILKNSLMDMDEIKKNSLMDLDDLLCLGKKKAADDIMLDDIDDSTTSKKKAVDEILSNINGVDTSSSNHDEILEVTNNNTNNDEEMSHNNPHKESDIAKGKSHQVLTQLATILEKNPDFCSETRRKEWLEDIRNLSKKISPQTVFGVLGNTGVGKSSLLNGLLDEAAVLPTSGSRGCTAAVVELVFHSELTIKATNNDNDNEDAADQSTIPVYRGEVELITLEDWRKELKALVDECSTQEKAIYARCPEEDSMPDAAQAWQKIEQVYGKGAMEQYRREPTDVVFNRLANNLRVKNLLTATKVGQDHNTIVVEAGEVIPGSDDAKELLKGYHHGQMKSRMKSKKKKWAMEFRKQINTYVYRMGNGDQPQTWPLIRKVQLKGPWSVLSTGAVLVDLPGVRDSNAARAKVAESYLQNCNQIAVVAPIKRAVDDGTAKELLGEQFKRRLLMDGNYGNVFFICTQTDDIEATETMRDHADVAQEVPGRWEKMTELADSISDFETQFNPLLQQEEDLEGQVEEAKQQYKESLEDLKQAEEAENEDSDDEEVDTDLLENLKAVISDNKSAFVKAKQDLVSWREDHSPTMGIIQGKCDRLQKKLKALCSTVRNEYSKHCLQADFKSGLKELYRKDDDDDRGNDNDDTQTALPEELNMDVFCISANDYLKLMKIKPSRDGGPSTFANAGDTQIPQLRSFVHETTARFCKSSVKTFVENTNDLLDQMKLLAADVDNVPTGRSAFRMKSLFETAMRDLASKVDPIARDFQQVIDQKIQRSLVSSLRTGAQKGSNVAMNTVHSWGSKSRRTKSEHRSDKNGLHYSTYNAVARRDGVYTSLTVGAIDFNQELCDPMEKEFSTEWQSVLDSTIRRLLSDAEKTILQLCTSAGQSFAQSLRSNGVDAARLTSMLNTANRSAITALKVSFGQMSTVAVNAQRELSRELLPAVSEKMKSTYQSVNQVLRGSGSFMRMKGAMTSNSQHVVHDMFNDAMEKLLAGIQSLIKQLKAMIESTSEVIGKAFDNVFSICWDDQQSEALVSPEMQQQIRACRDALLPELNELVKLQGSACEDMGIEREEVELDVMGVETFDQTLARKKEEAKKNGDMFDLCDSDAEMSIQPKNGVKVKGEKKAKASSAKSPAQSDMDVIDLCDSDNDDGWMKPAASRPKSGRPTTSVKDEAFL